jgi:predicted kinase
MLPKILTLVRGLPGSGKSTFANWIWADYAVFEADKYFMVDGEYKFDPSKLKEAHAWCLNEVKSRMEENKESQGRYYPEITVSNTFTQEWEMQSYIDLANQYGYTIFTIVVENRHGNSSVHNVPEETINKMKNRFEIKL